MSPVKDIHDRLQRAEERLDTLRTFLETIARDPWADGRLKVAARDALHEFDAPPTPVMLDTP